MNLRRLLVMTIAMMAMFSFHSFGQNKTVTGRVTDANGNPVPGATVSVKGTHISKAADNNGAFELSVPAATKKLFITASGQEPMETEIGTGSTTVRMKPAVLVGQDVVVIGYGTKKKADLTGSVSSVSAKDFQQGAMTSPEQLISGKIPGVSITSYGGQPGGGSQIRIRGGSSLNASNDPLIVIDGVPLNNPTLPGANGNEESPLSLINSDDIESFTVLKDASAAAIYGTRAANGVIIITTKKGKSGKFKMTFSSVNSMSSVAKEMDVLNGNQVRSIVDAAGNSKYINQLGTANTNWQKQIYQTAYGTDDNLNFTGGIKGLPYKLNLGAQDVDGVLKTDNMKKYSADIDINPVLFNNSLKVDLNVKGTIQNARLANQGAIGAAIGFDPTQPVYSNNKNFGGYYQWLDPSTATGLMGNAARNPMGVLMQNDHQQNNERGIGNIQLDYKFPFLPDLHAIVNLGFDALRSKGNDFIPDSAATNYNINPIYGGSYSLYREERMSKLGEYYLSYNKDLKSIKSHFDIMGGYSYNDYAQTDWGFPSYYGNRDTLVPNTQPTFPSTMIKNVLISYFGRANYSYDDRFFLTGTIRKDGSSKFASDNRWGVFPSGAFAWKIKNESFLKNSRVISDLKLRVGYGVTGQQDGVGDYDYYSYYALSNLTAQYNLGGTYYQMYRPGGYYANRKWEQTATENAGVDFGFLNNRITGSIDVYKKNTTDLLNTIAQPAGANFSATILANVGSMYNKGIELNINAEAIRTKDFTWDVAFNFTYNKNMVTKLSNTSDTAGGYASQSISGTSDYAFWIGVNHPKNTFFLYHQVYDPTTGRPIDGLMADVNRDGSITQADKYFGKQADPPYFLGFSTSATYKKWNAGFVLRANIGNYVYNDNFSTSATLKSIAGGYTVGNAPTEYLTSLVSGASTIQPISDYYIYNASFLKMDNVNVGYNFGKFRHSDVGLRMSISVQNVFVITKYPGIDPELSGGYDQNLYPRPRTISLGFNLNF